MSRPRERGITLAETVVAAALLLITFAAFLDLLPASLIAERRSQARTQAVAQAQSVLETALSQSFSSLAETAEPLSLPEVVRNGITYHAIREITTVNPYLKQIDVTVTWEEPGYRTRAGERVLHLRSVVSRVRR